MLHLCRTYPPQVFLEEEMTTATLQSTELLTITVTHEIHPNPVTLTIPRRLLAMATTPIEETTKQAKRDKIAAARREIIERFRDNYTDKEGIPKRPSTTLIGFSRLTIVEDAG
jgi:hypothetical protein